MDIILLGEFGEGVGGRRRVCGCRMPGSSCHQSLIYLRLVSEEHSSALIC